MGMKKTWYIHLILLIGAMLMIFPFVWMFLSAFKTDMDVFSYPPKWLPSTWTFENFSRVLEMIPFGRYYLNSIIVTFAITFGQVFLAILAAYALARLHFPGKIPIMIFLLSTMIMPFQVTLIPTFIIVYKLGWIDTYQGLIVPFLYSGFSIFFLRQFFVTIPKDLEDAAKIDGCGYFRILFNVIVPNSKAPIGTISLFVFLTYWRSYLWPLVVTNSPEMRTLPIGLKYFVEEGGTQYNLMMAASLMAIVPVLIVYILAERYLVKSTTLTGLKF
ncbi:MAG: multiple sugar transport system permease protein [Kosmotoga sp.]|uniref:Binding-protein-dependent transport systems inner membrane component n=2 Tax=Kosmotogaceae TaxID=1643948 RepID=C5CGY1_KOSOT|nr:binding-protein-dependent transport systems inner membrane component [Kosmotoga olearia TBF 19.5.1]MDI3524450.1 multiple sugar transport system permease protein [Kosmotoga sp.]MDK2953084.1 multiple sugar transport system permease protein [Kosmotoga sp.]